LDIVKLTVVGLQTQLNEEITMKKTAREMVRRSFVWIKEGILFHLAVLFVFAVFLITR